MNIVKQFRLQKWSKYILAIELEHNEVVWYFVPPEELDGLMKAYDPLTIQNLDEFPKYKNISIFGVYPIGFDLSPWHENGFTTIEALDWKLEGKFGNPGKAKLWKKFKFSHTEPVRWLYFAGMTPEAAYNLRELSVTIENLKQWIHTGFKVVDTPKWIVAGFVPGEAKPWYDKKFSVQEAMEWKDIGVSAHNANLWKKFGFTQETSRPWREENFQPSSVSEWQAMGVDNAVDARFWLDTGLDAEYIDRWIKAGFNAEKAKQAMEEGWEFPPE